MQQQYYIESIENFYNEFETSGKCDKPKTVQLDSDLLKWAKETSDVISEARNDSKYGVSSLIREAVLFFRSYFKYRSKLKRYFKSVVALLESLP